MPVLVFLFALWSHSVVAADADLILHGGRIVTVDRQFSIHQAIAIRGNRIVQTGADAEVLQQKGPATETVDLQGRMVLPGLIDSHTHPVAAALTEFDHPVPQMDTIADVLEYIRARAKILDPGQWIVIQQVFITRLREQRYPTRTEMDLAAPRHPVVFRTGPDASMNSLALAGCGIDRNFKIPAGLPGRVEKGADGEPTGILRTFANYTKIPAGAARQPNTEDRLRAVAGLFRDYNTVGITSIADRDASATHLDLYKELKARGELPVRISASRHIDTLGSLADIQQEIRRVAQDPLFTQKDPSLRIIGIKSYLDGGMLTGSAYMRQPWGVSTIYGISDPEYRGTLFIPPDRLEAIVQTAVESSLQFTAHTVGDGAVHALLHAYAAVNQRQPIRSTRPCISHANFQSEQAIARMAELGVSADLQPVWLYLDTRTLVKHFGDERLRWFQPLRSLFRAGVTVGGGSDHMQKVGSLRSINPYNPFLGMATAVTRQARWHESALHPEERLTREQAIRFYTINNATLLFWEQQLGSLEPGKLADLVVLDTDLLSCPDERLAATRVLRTYRDGKLVYRQ